MSRSVSRRAPVAALLIALLPVVMAGLGSPAAAQAPPPDTDRSGRSVSAIAGEQVRIDGTARKRARQAVVLQRRADGGWRAEDRGRTDRIGHYAFDVQVREAATYRVVARDAWVSARTNIRVVDQRGTDRKSVV